MGARCPHSTPCPKIPPDPYCPHGHSLPYATLPPQIPTMSIMHPQIHHSQEHPSRDAPHLSLPWLCHLGAPHLRPPAT